MTTYSIPESLPQPATCYPFQPGDAVYYAPYPAGFSNTQQLIPAIVVKAQPKPITASCDRPRVSILRKDGKRTSVQGCNLVYQGYCNFCGVPAVLDCKALICPKCGEAAIAVPPPSELILRWYPIGQTSTAQTAREGFLTGCTWGEALRNRIDRHHGAFKALLNKHGMLGEMHHRRGPWTEENDQWAWFSQVMHWYADLDDEESFLAFYRAHASEGKLPNERLTSIFEAVERILFSGDGPGGPSRRMVLPPLDIERIADDSEPDGPCEITRWLDQQFAA